MSGLVVFVVSITGALWCWEEELQNLFLPYHTIEKQEDGANVLRPSGLIESVSNELGNRQVTYMQFRGKGKSAIFSHYSENEQLQAYLNPYSGKCCI